MRRTLGARLAWLYGIALALTLTVFSVVVYAVVEAGDEDSPEVEAQEHTGRHLLITLLAALPVALAAGIGGVVVVTRRALAPLNDVVATSERLHAQALSLRMPVRDDMVDEIARLVEALNAMLARLEGSVEAMRRFTADASHELRTPMATMMGELELTLRHPRSPEELRAAIEGALESLGRWARLVDALLMLARSDNGNLAQAPERLDLGQTVARILEPFEPLLAERRLTLQWTPPAPLTLSLDPLWLGRVVANLVDNACKFTPPGGRVSVRVDLQAGRPRVLVDDTAPRLGEQERARVFERFYRGEVARADSPGFGLGLPLARQMARALGGDVRCEPGPDGNRFVVELPAAEAA